MRAEQYLCFNNSKSWVEAAVRSKFCCCPHCVCGFVFGPCFVLEYLVSFLVLQSSR